MASDDVSTSMDQLVGLLENSSAIKVGDAAKQLDVEKERVESWAKMLEKAEVLTIHYSVIGGAILKRGPKFDAILKAKSAPVSQSLEAPRQKILQPSQPAQPPSQAAQQAPSQRPAETRSRIEPMNAQGEYVLIRKRIDNEEKTIEDDLRRLRDEQAIVARYMDNLGEEQKKLSEYVEALREVVDQMNEKVDKRLDGASQ